MRDCTITTAPTTHSLARNLERALEQHAALSVSRNLKRKLTDTVEAIILAASPECAISESICSTMGYRKKQEDRANITSLSLSGIFLDPATDPLKIATIIHSSVISMEAINREYDAFTRCGATLTGAVVTPQGIFAFGAGDGATLLITVHNACDGSGKKIYEVLPLTTIHSAEYNIAECERAVRTNGQFADVFGILRLNSELIPLRGAGDLRFEGRGMTHHPEITHCKFSTDPSTLQMVLCVSDGVLDVMGTLQIEQWLNMTQLDLYAPDVNLSIALIREVIIQAHPEKANLENCTSAFLKIKPILTTHAQCILVTDGHGTENGHLPAEWVVKFLPQNLNLFFKHAETFFHTMAQTTCAETADADIRSLESLFVSLKLIFHVLLSSDTSDKKNTINTALSAIWDEILAFHRQEFSDLTSLETTYTCFGEKRSRLLECMSALSEQELTLGLARLYEAKLIKHMPKSITVIDELKLDNTPRMAWLNAAIYQRICVLTLSGEKSDTIIKKVVVISWEKSKSCLLNPTLKTTDPILNELLKLQRAELTPLLIALDSSDIHHCLPLLISREETIETFEKKCTKPYALLMDAFFEKNFSRITTSFKEQWITQFFNLLKQKKLVKKTSFYDEGAYEMIFECFQAANQFIEEQMVADASRGSGLSYHG